jgi:signal transduction histidine kinase
VTWWHAVRRGADPRELPLALGLAVLLVVDGLLQLEGDIFEPPVAAVGALVLATAPVLWRRSAPRVALVASVAGALAVVPTIAPYDVVVVPVMVCAYSVAVDSDRRGAALTALLTVALACGGVAVSLDVGATWVDMVLDSVLLLLAVVTGDAVRARRAFHASQRAREAERERERQAQARQQVAEERVRIAQEVHDVVAHAMVAISVQAGTAAHVVDRRPGQAHVALRAIKDAADAALADLTRTLGLLREEGAPAPLHPAESLEAVAGLAVPLRAAGITVEMTIAGAEDRVPPEVGAAAFRIAQEATTNILRHAGASRASLTVEVGERALSLVVQDDGAALVPVGGPVEPGSGNGLRGMRERAAAVGGRLEAGRRPDGTWRVHAELPLR